MTQRQSFGTLIAYVTLILAAVACATALCALGKIDSAAAMAVLGGAVTGAAVLVNSTAAAAINGGPKPDMTKLAVSDPQALASLLAKHPTPAPAPAAVTAEAAAQPARG